MRNYKNQPLTLFIVAAIILTIINSCKDNEEIVSLLEIPVIETNVVGNIGQTTATSGGIIDSDGGATITSRGVCWSKDITPTIADNITINGAGAGSFTSEISGLETNTKYFLRAYATNSIGTGYGSAMSFVTEFGPTDTVKDIDGNAYHVIRIGSQTWMVENLKTTRYRNGDNIQQVVVDSIWNNRTIGAFCYYYNDENNGNTYGCLYNWYAVNDSRNIAPVGWHVPTSIEWNNLIDYLGGTKIAGGKLKETGLTHWLTPNKGATNESGFTGLPGGGRSAQINKPFNAKSEWGYFWSSTEFNVEASWFFTLNYIGENAYGNTPYKNNGFSVRCIKD